MNIQLHISCYKQHSKVHRLKEAFTRRENVYFFICWSQILEHLNISEYRLFSKKVTLPQFKHLKNKVAQKILFEHFF